MFISDTPYQPNRKGFNYSNRGLLSLTTAGFFSLHPGDSQVDTTAGIFIVL
jgi:hypothetical protein